MTTESPVWPIIEPEVFTKMYKYICYISGDDSAGSATVGLFQEPAWSQCGPQPVCAVVVTETRENYKDYCRRQRSQSTSPSHIINTV